MYIARNYKEIQNKLNYKRLIKDIKSGMSLTCRKHSKKEWIKQHTEQQ